MGWMDIAVKIESFIISKTTEGSHNFSKEYRGRPSLLKHCQKKKLNEKKIELSYGSGERWYRMHFWKNLAHPKISTSLTFAVGRATHGKNIYEMGQN